MTVHNPTRIPRLVPIKEGIFNVPARIDATAELLGARCRECSQTFFPRRVHCAACTGSEMEQVEFAGHGTIDTFTIVRQQPPNSVMEPPYAIVRVALDGGPTIETVMATDDIETARIGARVRLAIRQLKKDETGDLIVSFMARPATQERSVPNA
jgi:uncharacterized OB-fold protein